MTINRSMSSDHMLNGEFGLAVHEQRQNQTLPTNLPISSNVEVSSMTSHKRKRQHSDFETIQHCPTCGRRTEGRKGSMDYQETVHFPKSMYVCGLAKHGEPCETVFLRRDNAREHMKNIHSFSTSEVVDDLGRRAVMKLSPHSTTPSRKQKIRQKA